MFRALVSAAVLACMPLTAGDWTRQDTLAEAAVLASLYCDWNQTRQIAVDPDLYERNPILGRHPSAGNVNRYFIAATLAHIGLAYVMKPKARHFFQGATIAMEIGSIANNYHLGVKVKF